MSSHITDDRKSESCNKFAAVFDLQCSSTQDWQRLRWRTIDFDGRLPTPKRRRPKGCHWVENISPSLCFSSPASFVTTSWWSARHSYSQIRRWIERTLVAANRESLPKKGSYRALLFDLFHRGLDHLNSAYHASFWDWWALQIELSFSCGASL